MRIETALAGTLSAGPGIIGAFPDEVLRSYKRRIKAERSIPCVIGSAVALVRLPERFFA
jgi:hypothetical protein